MAHFPGFQKKFPKPDSCQPMSKSLEEYQGRLPGSLIEFLSEQGACSYAKGLIWTMDPFFMQDTLEEWLDEPENAVPFARTAFGELFLWQEGAAYYLNVQRGAVTKVISSVEKFFDGFLLNENIQKKVFRKSLFAKALKEYGPISADEVYALTPALALGGAEKVENLRKTKLREYLAFLAGQVQ